MKITVIRILTLLPILFFGRAMAQTFNMANASVTACSGTFYDSQGATTNYNNNENFTYTICPTTAGSKLNVVFTQFDLENGSDFLQVYDGPNIASPQLASLTGTVLPATLQASASNTSGCLTFRFISDGSVRRPGWAAQLSCVTCQTITAQIASTIPATNAGIIKTCQGATVSFNGSGTFSGSSANAIYTWNFGDGTSATGANVTHVYPTTGSYIASLSINAAGCTNNNTATVNVQVSTTPTISTTGIPSPICLGQSANLNANVVMNPFVQNCTPPVSGTTFLPDGDGVSYTTAINVNCYSQGQTITAANQISNICLTMEHSYLGDLDIELICPNGQSMILINSAGASANLGTPVATATVDGNSANTAPGIGALYCFTPSATATLASSILMNGSFPNGSGGNYTDSYVPAGNYAPLNSFANLIGCPLNGSWTIQVTDNLLEDNGYIFNWDVNFTATPAANGFTAPLITSQGWSAATGLNSTGTTSATVTPAATGSQCYTYSLTDNFGCTYNQVQCVTVNPSPTVTVNSPTVCAGVTATVTATPGAAGAYTYAWTIPAGAPAPGNVSSFTTTVAGVYTVVITNTASNCSSTASGTVTVNPLPIVQVNNPQFCIGGSATLTASGATTYSWTPSTGLSATTGATVTATPAATTIYTVTGTTAGCTSSSQATVTVGQPATVNANIDQTVCAGGTITLAGSTGGSATSATWSATSGSFSNPALLNSTYTPSITNGTVTLTLTTNDPAGPCPAVTDIMVVTVNPLPVVNAGSDISICSGNSTTLTASGATTYSWLPGGQTTAAITVTPLTTTTYTVSGTTSGCIATDQVVVTVNALPIVSAGGDQTICVGTSVTLSGSGATNYTWNNGVTNAVSFAPTSTATYTVTGTDANGCFSTDQVVVNVNALPVVLAGSDLTICAGANVTLSGAGASTYTWNNGVTNGTLFAPSTTSTYTVTGTDANNCENTDQILVTVNPLPVVNAGADLSVCTGGSATLTATGATTYSWSPGGQTTASITVTPSVASTYTVTGTSLGCTSTDAVTVSILSNAAINAGPDLAICNGSSTVLTATGGTIYSWNNGLGNGNGLTISPTSTTTYTVVGTDANGCTGTDAITITVNPLPSVNAGSDLIICAGANVTLSGAGASTYTWNNGVTNGVSFAPTSTATYTVTGTDLNGCINTDQVTVTVNALPIVFAGNDLTICAGASVTLNGTGASTYSWNNTVTNGLAFSPISTNTYTVTGTAVNGCINTDQVTVTVNPLPTVSAGSDQVICLGETVTLSGSGATSYVWNNGVVDGVAFSPLVTTTYNVIGTDANGCFNSDQVTVTVNALPAVVAVADFSVCAGNSVTLSGSGAANYSWDNGVANGVAFTPTATATYTLTGTSLAGCINTDQVVVTVNALPLVNAGSDLSVCSSTPVTLNGTGASVYNWSNGITNGIPFTPSATATYTLTGTDINGCVNTDDITVTVLSTAPVNAGSDIAICAGSATTLTATGALNYTWNNGVTNGTAFTPAATTTYTVVGTDAAGCIGTDNVTVTVNPLPIVSGGSNQTVCAGTSVTLTGTGASTYSWTGGILNGTSFVPTATTTYTVTGTTTLGCTSTANVLVTVNTLPIVNAGTDQTVCAGTSVTLNGAGAANYTWSGGVTNGVAFTPTATATYTLTGTSAAGCTATDVVTVTVNPLPVVNAGQDQTICVGVTPVTLTATGATTYSWDNGVTNGLAFAPLATATYTVTGTTGAGCTAVDQVLVTVNPLPVVNAGQDQTICAGTSVTLTGTGAASYSWNNSVLNSVAFVPTATTTYTVTGSSTAGCTNTDQVVVTVNPLPIVNAGSDQTICAGTSVTLTGTGAAIYTWTGGVSNGVSFVPTATTTYTVTGTSTESCISTDQVVVTVNPLPVVNAGADQTVCAGTVVTLTGTGASNYTWNNGVNNGVGFTPAIGTVTYTVTGTSAANCISTDQMTVSVNPNPVPTINGPTQYCATFSATLGTNIPYTTYAWSTGASTPTINATIANNPITVTVTNNFGCSATTSPFTVSENAQITANFTETICQGESVLIHGIAQTVAGVYSQTFSTASGCDSVANVTLVVNPLPAINAGFDQSVCTGASTTLSAAGGVNYTWDNAVLNGVSFVQAIGTTVYTVTGTDINGCINTDEVSITVNSLPLISAGQDQAICVGPSVTLNGSGGTSYTWNNGVTNGVAFTPAATNTYTVTGTDANGCINTDQVVVTVNPLPSVNAGLDQPICFGASITLTGSGASNYTWNNGVTNAVAFVPASTTTYTVTGTDLNGCINTDQVVVTVNSLPLVNAGSDFAICNGASTTLVGSGASSYTWNNGVTNNIAFGPAATNTYTVTGTDANGCINTDDVVVTVNALPLVDAGLDQAVCTGTSATLSGSGATSYAWNNGVTNATAFTPALTNTYTVTGTDGNGCTNTDQVVVTVNALPLVNAGADQVTCIGGAVTLNGSGASTYTWDNGVTNGASFVPAVTTTYTVTGTDINGCVNTDQVLVTVNTTPTVNAGSDQTVCAGTTVTLTGTGASTYSWDNGITQGVAFTPAVGTLTYTVTGTSGANCIATDVVVVTVNALPTVNAGLDQAFCIGNTATLTGSGATTYTWNNGVTNATAFTPALTNTYTVTGTDGNGCTNTDQVTVTVNPLPLVGAGADQVTCIGGTVTLNGSGASIYTWDNGVTNGVSFAPAATTTYTVTGEDINGCINTDQVLVTVNTLPTVNAGSDQIVCTGTTVTLTGTGASAYSWDNGVNNGVSFTPGVGSLTYTVTGTSGANCIATDQVVVTVNALPLVSAGLDQALCIGETATLSGSGATTYTWNNGVTNGTVFTPAATTTYTVTGTDGNGCVNTDQVVVTVNNLPSVDAGNDQAICIGANVTLFGAMPLSVGGSTFTWDNGVTNGVAFAPASTATYTVTGTDANGCLNTDQVIVTVNTLPIVNAGPDQTVCLSTSVTLVGAGATNYTWNNGVNNGVAFTPVVGTTVYTVTGTNGNNCVNTDQVTVVVNPLPIVDAGEDNTICPGQSFTLIGTGSGAITYSWNNGVTNGVPFTPSSTTTYTVTGTDANGCSNSDQIVITIAPTPNVFAGNDVVICEGQSAVLTASGASTYTWDNNVVNGVTFTPSLGTTVYTVTGTSIFGCIGTDQVSVTLELLPVVGFTADITSGCSPLEVNFTNNTVGSTSCNWLFGNGTTINGCGTVPAVFSQAGCFDVTLITTSANGCSNSLTIPNYICVEENPMASFNPASTIVTTLDTDVQFNNTSNGADNYVWNFGDESMNSTIESPNHTYPSAGDVNYYVTLVAISSLGCVDTAYGFVQVQEEVIYYVPNSFTPDFDDYNQTFKPIFTSGFDPFDYTLLIYNRWGEVIFESRNAAIGWQGTYGVDGELVQDGTYTWTIEYKRSINDARQQIQGHVTIIR